MTEHWVSIPQYPRYRVSQYARVYDVVSDRLLEPSIDSGGYLRVKLHHPDGFRKNVSLHRIVALSFFDITEDEFEDVEVNHLDFNKMNCALSNLEITDRSGNMLHAFLGGRARSIGRIRKIRIVQTGEVFESTGQIDRYLNVSSGSVSKTLRGLQNTCKGFTFEYVE